VFWSASMKWPRVLAKLERSLAGRAGAKWLESASQRRRPLFAEASS
jgi:hypothetical protein